MPLLAKAVASLACAALLAATPVLAGPAGAHPHAAKTHQHSHATRHGHAAEHGTAHRHAKTDHLAGLRRGATHAVAAQVKVVQGLVDQAAGLTIADAAGLQAALAFDLTAAQTDQDGVATAETAADIHSLMRAAIIVHQLARLQFEAVQAADAIADQAAALSLTVAQLQGQLGDMPGNAEALALLDEAAMLLESISSQLPGVVDFVLGLAPTISKTDLHAANVNVQTVLTSLQESLDQANLDVTAAQA
jgi:hypothetical protein